MENNTANTANRIRVDVAADHMAAYIHLQQASVCAELTADEVLDALREAKIAINDRVTLRATEFANLVTSGNPPTEQFLIAEGTPAVEGKDGEFTWSDDFQRLADAWQDDSPINYYKMSNIATVDRGTVIGRVQPAVCNQEGTDVFGHTIAPQHHPSEIELDSSVSRSSDDPNVVIAGIPGRIIFDKGRLSITEALIVPGDIDLESGSVTSSVDIQVAGTVRDGFDVKSDKSITVGGAIESANVEAQGNIVVRGGILGHGQGNVRAGGDVVAKYCATAHLHAGGNISIHKEARDSEIHAEGQFSAAHGIVIGGQLYAREGVEVATLGSQANTPTSVIIGIHPHVLKEAEILDREAASRAEVVAKTRQTIQPLLTNQKRLPPSQKERATELLYQADTIEEEIVNIQKRREEMIENARAKNNPAVLVTKIIHPKVSIQIGRRRITFDAEMKGPVRIEERKMKNVTEFVVINQTTGSTMVLPSTRVDGRQGTKPEA